MAEQTDIEWADHTWSPHQGCQKVSLGCDNCYAEHLLDTRFHKVVWGPHGARRQLSDAHWREPVNWNEKARCAGQAATVFPSTCDPFDNHVSITDEMRARFHLLQRNTPNLTWLLLTKRPQLIDRYTPEILQNVWHGASIENQQEADRRLPYLCASPAPLLFLSCEPLLGPVDLRPWLSRVGWVIVGGESGYNARPMDPAWARNLREQCRNAGVPFFMKQLGAQRKPFPPIPADLLIREFPQLRHG